MTDTARIIAAVETVWDALRTEHPELPAVSVAIHTTGAPHNLRYPEEGGAIHGRPVPPELPVHVDTVRNGGHAILECVVHAATHALCAVRGIQETSNRGRRHNGRFADVAKELGGHWPDTEHPHPVKGYSPVPLADTFLADMRPYVEALDTVTADVDADTLGRPATRRDNRMILRCECGRTVQMGRRVAAQGPVICGVCRTEFKAA